MKNQIRAILGLSVILFLGGCQPKQAAPTHTSSSSSSVVVKKAPTVVTAKTLQTNEQSQVTAAIYYGAGTFKTSAWQEMQREIHTSLVIHKAAGDDPIQYQVAMTNNVIIGYTPAKTKITLCSDNAQVGAITIKKLATYVDKHFTKSAWRKAVKKTTIVQETAPTSSSSSQAASSASHQQTAAASSNDATSASNDQSAASSDDSDKPLTLAQANAIMKPYFQSVYNGKADGYTFAQLKSEKLSDEIWIYRTPDQNYFWYVQAGGVYSPRQNHVLLEQ
ncbi:hypothetical protein [Lacticaseibacillus brantae]|uniref:Lipoprotein n=1 Tax=Lacticaseibacillus brantae DSM 23927 TaxID=1423727 RepID=A0A0R2AW98_9LACO|nr:hypothetical protein [Lacticaseibacillus brantae]KRM71726.1 hypothetical protein FC34_GL001385 [Lacticaseibacillus brantae DSM 23927]